MYKRFKIPIQIRLLFLEISFIFTRLEMLQRILEKPLEKKAGRNYAPPGSKKLIYFIDDLNMPGVSKADNSITNSDKNSFRALDSENLAQKILKKLGAMAALYCYFQNFEQKVCLRHFFNPQYPFFTNGPKPHLIYNQMKIQSQT